MPYKLKEQTVRKMLASRLKVIAAGIESGTVSLYNMYILAIRIPSEYMPHNLKGNVQLLYEGSNTNGTETNNGETNENNNWTDTIADR